MRLSFLSYCFTAVLLTQLAACGSSKRAASSNEWETIVVPTADSLNKTPAKASSAAELRTKYATWLKTHPDSLRNMRLYSFMDEWMYTPYCWGGNDKKGIDCSAFMQRLLQEVYGISIPRTSVEQFFHKNIEPFHDAHYFSEGDLIFFSTIPGKPVSHVGFYLQNRMFVNASSSQGVSIGNLDDPYWKKRYVAAGRIRRTK